MGYNLMPIISNKTFTRRSLLTLTAASLGALVLPKSRATPLPKQDLRLGLFSDINSSYGSTAYISAVGEGIRLLLANKPNQVICAGDMIAGQKLGLSPTQLDDMWHSFHRQILQPIQTAGLPFIFSLGNHDASSSKSDTGYQFEVDRAAALRFWQSQKDNLALKFIDSSGFPFYYTALVNDIFWLIWDASSAQISNQQQNWARRQLASQIAKQAKLRMAVGHLSLRGISRGRDLAGEVLDQANQLQQILENGDVHAYISGHQHAYYPARLGELDLIQLGATGSGPRQLLVGNLYPRQSISLLDIYWQNQEIIENSYEFPGGRQINWNHLPNSLPSRNGPLMRRLSNRSLINNKNLI